MFERIVHLLLKLPAWVLVVLWVMLSWYDRFFHGSEGKNGQSYKYKTRKDGEYAKPKGLLNIFKPWRKLPPPSPGDLAVNSM